MARQNHTRKSQRLSEVKPCRSVGFLHAYLEALCIVQWDAHLFADILYGSVRRFGPRVSNGYGVSAYIFTKKDEENRVIRCVASELTKAAGTGWAL